MDLRSVLGNVKDVIFSILRLNNFNLVGLDIGNSFIKAAVIELHGSQIKVLKFEYLPLPDGIIYFDEILNEEDFLEQLETIRNSLGLKYSKINVGHSGSNTLLKRIQLLGDIAPEDLADQISWEIEQYLPFDITSALISHNVIKELDGGGLDIIVAAASDEIVAKKVDILKEVGFNVAVVDINAIALTNLFEHIYQDSIVDDHSYILIDMGGFRTTFIIYKDKGINFCKEIDMGSNLITDEIQRSMSLNKQEAEHLKVFGDGSGNVSEEVLEITKEVLRKIFLEIKKGFDFYKTLSTNDVFSGVYISGGASNIAGITDGLNAVLDIPVYHMDIAAVLDNSNLSEKDLNFICTNGAIALGLALRKFEL